MLFGLESIRFIKKDRVYLREAAMRVDLYFKGKNVVITGGSSGIGKSAGKLLASYGANVFILARRKELLLAAQEEISKSAAHDWQKFGWYSVAVQDYTGVKEIMDKIAADFGPPHVLINSAAIARPGYVQELPLEVFQNTLNIDYLGTVNAVKAVIPFMMERREGHITNIGSVAGLIGVFGYTAYSGAKFAVTGFSQSLRAELKPYNVYVSLLCPPDTDTPQLEEENKFKPEETRAITKTAKRMSPEDVAKSMAQGMARKKFMILPNFESRIIYRLSCFFPALVDAVMDARIRKVQSGRSNRVE